MSRATPVGPSGQRLATNQPRGTIARWVTPTKSRSGRPAGRVPSVLWTRQWRRLALGDEFAWPRWLPFSGAKPTRRRTDRSDANDPVLKQSVHCSSRDNADLCAGLGSNSRCPPLSHYRTSRPSWCCRLRTQAAMPSRIISATAWSRTSARRSGIRWRWMRARNVSGLVRRYSDGQAHVA